jgi:rhamnose transport system permease protein
MRPMRKFEYRSAIAMLAFFAAVVSLMAVAAPQFFSAENAFDIAANSSYVAIAACGMLVVVLIGQIDVSVGAILAICCAVTAALGKAGVSLGWLVPLAVLIGGLLGAVNGALVALLRVHSIVVTLGMLNVYRGLLIVGTQGIWISGLPPSFRFLGEGSIGPVPASLVAVGTVLVLMWMLLTQLRIGREFYAVGSNPEAARLAGITVPAVQVRAFALCGALTGLAAVAFAGRFGSVESNTGQGFELVVISAVVLGGADIFGGRGTLTGTVLGAVMVSTLGTVLIFLGVDAIWEQAVQGLAILLAVLYYTLQGGGLLRWLRRQTARRPA